VYGHRRCRTEPASSHSERRSSGPLAPPPAKEVPGGFSMLMATCMQPGKSTAVVTVVQGASVGPVFARRRCRTEPASSHSERRSSSPLAPPPAKQVPAASPCLRQPACNGARAEQPLWWCKGLLSAQFLPAAAAAPSPPLATASAVAQAH